MIRNKFRSQKKLNLLLSNSRQDVRVTSVKNGQDTNSEQSTTSGTQLVVTTLEVVDLSSGQHGVVFQLGLSQSWSVSGNDDQLGLGLSDSLNGRFVTQGIFTGFDGQGQFGVDVLGVLLNFWCHLCEFLTSFTLRSGSI